MLHRIGQNHDFQMLRNRKLQKKKQMSGQSNISALRIFAHKIFI